MEVTKIARENGKAEFEGGGADEEVYKRHGETEGGLFTANPPRKSRCHDAESVDGNVLDQLCQKGSRRTRETASRAR